MKPFILDSTMTTIGGVFYPTGQVFAMFPDETDARETSEALRKAGHSGAVAYAGPETILQDIAYTLGTADMPLPSVGADGDMVRRIADMAGHGHHGLLIPIESKDNIEKVVDILKEHGANMALYYRTFIIEDLITQPADDDPQSVLVGTHTATH